MRKFERHRANCLKVNVKEIMKSWIIVATFFLLPAALLAQKINGQWRGYFNSSGDIVLTGGATTEYVLEIEINGSQISGFSYSYFQNRKYYVICSLTGTYYKSTKSMKITETARVKGVMPPDWSDCLQTHILSYQKNGDTEELTGRWVTAPGQVGECGKGNTTLTRRTVSRDLSSYNKSKNGTPFSAQKPVAKAPSLVEKNSSKPVTPPVAKTAPKSKPKITTTTPPQAKNNPVERDAPEIIAPEVKKQVVPILPPSMAFEKRSNDIIKTIEIEHATFKVDLYDNGEIDGDSISLFYNGKLLLSHKRLGDKPITLMLEANTGKETNELTMYAENLGIYPPNTALMVVTDGERRYEVRIASDLKKSGTIRFVKSGANGSNSANSIN
ncbi:MAG: hypothetical protein JWP81_1836 [Ferruginibacter sp.]|nr:hypothetical protein [Ferruginibacter sp.]